jgi:hypothetical protein
MKITDSEVIKNAEKELIDAINADLDWGVIEETFKKEHKLGIEEDVEYKTGDIVVFDKQIAYKLEFEVKVMLSVLLDRDGNYISIKSSGDPEDIQDEQDEQDEDEEVLDKPDSPDNPEDDDMTQSVSPPKRPQKGFSKMASKAKEIIAEISEEK